MLNRRKSLHSHSRPRLRLKSTNKQNLKEVAKNNDPLMTIKHLQTHKTPFKVRKLQKSHSKECSCKKSNHHIQSIKQEELAKGISRKEIQEKEGIYYPDNLLPQRADLDTISDSLVQKLSQKQILREVNDRYLIKKLDLLFVIKNFFADEYLPEVRLNKMNAKLQSYRSATEPGGRTIKHIKKRQNELQIEQIYSLNYPICDNLQQEQDEPILNSFTPPSIHKILSDKQKQIYKPKQLIKTHKNVVFTSFEDQEDGFCMKEENVTLQFKGDDELFRLLNITDMEKFKNKHQQLLYTYVNSQQDELAKKYLKQYKNLQEQMLCYSDLLHNRPEKTSPSVHKTLPAINRLIDMNLDNAINRLSDKTVEHSKKVDLTKHLIYTIRRQYTGLVKELNEIISDKSEKVREFQSKVTKWWDNYSFRRDFLSKIKDDYCSQLFSLFYTLKEFFLKVNEYPALRQSVEHLMAFLIDGLKKMDEFVLIGNNFY